MQRELNILNQITKNYETKLDKKKITNQFQFTNNSDFVTEQFFLFKINFQHLKSNTMIFIYFLNLIPSYIGLINSKTKFYMN